MDGRMDGWMDGVSLRCSFCGKSDVWMDGWIRSQQLDILAIRNKHNPKEPPFDPLKGVLTDSKHEVRKAADDFCPFLLPFRSLELPPEWSSFDGVPPGSINRLINNLKDDYYMALGQQIIY